MKQTILMSILLLFGTVGSFVKGPFYGVAVYLSFCSSSPTILVAVDIAP